MKTRLKQNRQSDPKKEKNRDVVKEKGQKWNQRKTSRPITFSTWYVIGGKRYSFVFFSFNFCFQFHFLIFFSSSTHGKKKRNTCPNVSANSKTRMEMRAREREWKKERKKERREGKWTTKKEKQRDRERPCWQFNDDDSTRCASFPSNTPSEENKMADAFP